MTKGADHTTGTSNHEFEMMRRASLRTFRVYLTDGTHEDVSAHYNHADHMSGHMTFLVITPDGRQEVRDTFNVREWKRVSDVTTEEQQDQGAKTRQMFGGEQNKSFPAAQVSRH